MVATSYFDSDSQKSGSVTKQIQIKDITLNIDFFLFWFTHQSTPRLCYGHILLQSEIEYGLARDFYLVSLGDDLRSCASATTNGCSNPSTFAAAGDRPNDPSYRCSAEGPFRGARSARLALQLVIAGHQ